MKESPELLEVVSDSETPQVRDTEVGMYVYILKIRYVVDSWRFRRYEE